MEDYGNGQQNGILASLDYETVNAMKAAETNWNNDFVSNGGKNNGQWQEYDGQNSSKSTGENLTGVTQGITNSAQLINSIITPKLTTYVSSYVTEVVMSYMQQAMVDMLSFDPGNIMSYAMAMMPNYLIDAGQIMNELLKPSESINEERANQELNKLTDEINKTINDKVGVVTNEINKKLSYINNEIGSIAFYATQGPAFVQQKIDLYIKKTIETCFKGIAKARDTVNDEKDKVIKSIGNKMGEQVAKKTNEKLKNQTKDQLMQIEQKKKDAMNKVKTQIINVKLKLMALIGG